MEAKISRNTFREMLQQHSQCLRSKSNSSCSSWRLLVTCLWLERRVTVQSQTSPYHGPLPYGKDTGRCGLVSGKANFGHTDGIGHALKVSLPQHWSGISASFRRVWHLEQLLALYSRLFERRKTHLHVEKVHSRRAHTVLKTLG